uniref:BZIP domain-containing protein n=1 Tax=Macrostomum lignano TaxID=282301 RepID=A0A1I8FIQ3_9PLAT
GDPWPPGIRSPAARYGRRREPPDGGSTNVRQNATLRKDASDTRQRRERRRLREGRTRPLGAPLRDRAAQTGRKKAADRGKKKRGRTATEEAQSADRTRRRLSQTDYCIRDWALKVQVSRDSSAEALDADSGLHRAVVPLPGDHQRQRLRRPANFDAVDPAAPVALRLPADARPPGATCCSRGTNAGGRAGRTGAAKPAPTATARVQAAPAEEAAAAAPGGGSGGSGGN